MDSVPPSHHRRTTRLPGYDYTLPGAYFVTLCTWQRECLFGEVVEGEMRLNRLGTIVEMEWKRLAIQFPLIQVDIFVVMPNHVHGIIIMTDRSVMPPVGTVGATHPYPTRGIMGNIPLPDTSKSGEGGSPLHENPRGPVPGSLGAVVGQFKSRVTKRVWALPNFPRHPIWQRNYYEHIFRDERDLRRIATYIQDNPRCWQDDDLHPR